MPPPQILFRKSRLFVLQVSLIFACILVAVIRIECNLSGATTTKLPNNEVDEILNKYKIHLRRNLREKLSNYADPKNVEQKNVAEESFSSELSTEAWRFPISASQMIRPINILAFGGSVTVRNRGIVYEEK
jgi:hypothetical protein